MKKRQWSLVLNIVFYSLVIFLLMQRVPTWIRSYNQQGTKPPEALVLVSLDGKEVAIPTQSKKALVYWATWCGPCDVELARLKRLVANGKIAASDVIAISIDRDPEALRRTVIEKQYPFIVVHDFDGSAARLFAVEVTPTIILLNADGTVEWSTSGISPTLEWRLLSFLR